MPRSPKPTFIAELPLVVLLNQDRVMIGRFESGRRLCNATLHDGLSRLDSMRASAEYAAARLLPKSKARSVAFKDCNESFGFTEYAMHTVATGHKNAAGFSDRLGAHETQKIATRVFAALQEYALGKRGRPRFKGAHRPLHSLEGKSNVAGIRWDKDTGTVSWGKLGGKAMVLPAKLPTKAQDPYLHAALASETKYCRIVWRQTLHKGKAKRRWFVQLVQAGVAPAKYEFLSSGQVVGLDIGPSTVAIVGDDAVGLEQFAPSVVQPGRPCARCCARWIGHGGRPILRTTAHQESQRREPGAGPDRIAMSRASCSSVSWSGCWRPLASATMASWPTRSWAWATRCRSRSSPTRAFKRILDEVPRCGRLECLSHYWFARLKAPADGWWS